METLAEELDLRQLDPEPWGARLLRARERVLMRTRDVAECLHPWVTKSGLGLLEHRDVEPTRKMDRARALMLLVLYGTDPADFGLSVGDAPTGMDLHKIRAFGETYREERARGADSAAALAIASSRCIALEAAA